MAFKGPKGLIDPELHSEINIIPMVDVMLVLLIIFMVAAPLMTDSMDVQLPKAKAKSTGIEKQSVILSIKKDETLYIGRTQMKPTDLSKKLKSIFESRDKKEIFIKADENVRHGFIIKVMATIQTAGILKISFMTDPSK